MIPYADYGFFSHIYADYDFYVDAGFDVMPEEKYCRFGLLAAQYINYVTFGRINPHYVPLNVRYCQCELVELMYRQNVSSGFDADSTPQIRSETVGSHSVSYAVSDNASMNSKTAETAKYEICKKWLTQPVNLMYTGVGLC